MTNKAPKPTIKSEATQYLYGLLPNFSLITENDYRTDLINIFWNQRALVLYPDATATAFSFAGTNYINPQYVNLYEQDIVLRSRPLHPSLVPDMQQFLKKYDEFLKIKNYLYSYIVHWFMYYTGYTKNTDLHAVWPPRYALPFSIGNAEFNSREAYPELMKKWDEHQKNQHEYLKTLFLKTQLIKGV